MITTRIGLLGCGAQARTIASFLAPGTELFWAVTSEYLEPGRPHLIDISAPEPAERDAAVVGAVGAPGLRRTLVNMWPGNRFATVVSDHAYVGTSCAIGPGSVVAPGAVITVDVVVNEHCFVNVGATLGHDVRLGSFVTVGPGVNVSGGTVVGDGAFIGTGANVSDGVTIAPGVVVGAGATVVSDVLTPNSVVVGTPAKAIKVRADWLNAL